MFVLRVNRVKYKFLKSFYEKCTKYSLKNSFKNLYFKHQLLQKSKSSTRYIQMLQINNCHSINYFYIFKPKLLTCRTRILFPVWHAQRNFLFTKFYQLVRVIVGPIQNFSDYSQVRSVRTLRKTNLRKLFELNYSSLARELWSNGNKKLCEIPFSWVDGKKRTNCDTRWTKYKIKKRTCFMNVPILHSWLSGIQLSQQFILFPQM